MQKIHEDVLVFKVNICLSWLFSLINAYRWCRPLLKLLVTNENAIQEDGAILYGFVHRHNLINKVW